MGGAALGHHQGRCSFETALAAFDLTADPRLRRSAASSTRPAWQTTVYDAPVAAGLDVLIRGLTLTGSSDHDTLTITDKLFDGLYEHTRRQLITGRPPA